MKKIIEINTGTNKYDITIGANALKGLKSYLEPFIETGNVFIVSDSNVSSLYKNFIAFVLQNSSNVSFCEIPAGEKTKNFKTIKLLCNEFTKAGLDRESLVIALGGGVVGDVAGFASAIYMRGIKYVQVPTTLLSMCDSSVGGKTGINLDSVKNQVGSFHQPSHVIIDTSFLETLPKKERLSGLGELIKTGVISDTNLCNMILDNPESIIELRDHQLLSEILLKSVSFKANIVEEDEKESGKRRILNFGHTIGHGIEAAMQKDGITHGEAVMFGMLCALQISESKANLDSNTHTTLFKKITPLITKNYIINLEFEQIRDFIKKDKKSINGKINFVLIEDIGKPVVTGNVTLEDMESAFNKIKAQLI